MSDLTLATIDEDEALLDAIAEVHGSTRARFLRTAAFGGAAMLAALAAPSAVAQERSDTALINFMLRFEVMQLEFYDVADEHGTLEEMPEEQTEWAETLGAHERAHVRIIRDFLGAKAEKAPQFNFGDVTETPDAFTRTAVAMEDFTVGFLTGVAPQIRDQSLLAALMSLVTVEARHAAWARNILGTLPAPSDFDEARTVRSVAAEIRRTNFIVSRPRTSASRRSPRFTG